MKCRRQSRQGSSTVLVILIMLSLIVFGLITMMSANANYRVSQRMAEWTKGYFTLESKATEALKRGEGIFDAETELYTFTVKDNDRIFEAAYTATGEIVVWRERPQDFEIEEIQYGKRR